MDNIEEQPHLYEASELEQTDEVDPVIATVSELERPSFGARLRMIVLLSLISWALVVAAWATFA